MRKFAMMVSVLAVSAATVGAQQLNLGMHGSYSTGGDVNESKAGGGAQAGVSLNEYLSAEISGTMFTDSDTGVDLDVTTFALSLRLGYPVVQQAYIYVGGGINYTLFEADASTLDLLASMRGVSGADLAAAGGFTVTEANAALRDLGISASLDVDNQFGGHVCVGGEYFLTDRISLFGEYRYTMSKLAGDIKVSEGGETASESFDDDYNFGLVRAGVNFTL